jgi:hypothetical protein
MPITKAEFERGRKSQPLEKPLLDFFVRNGKKAYTAAEVGQDLAMLTGQSFWTDLNAILVIIDALDQMVREGLLAKKWISLEAYYTLAAPSAALKRLAHG